MKRLSFVVTLVLFCASGGRYVGIAQQQVDIPPEVAQQAQANGNARVIVGVAAAVQPEGLLGAAAASLQRDGIAAAQTQALNQIAGTTYRVVRQFQTIPFLALEVAPDALAALAQSTAVTSIEEDRLYGISLAQSVPLVEGTGAWNAGFDGTGWTVAVLDTGVDRTHLFLAGKVVAEACFSGSGNCPNGSTTQIGTGAGVPCTYAVSGCRHGTHVAGIAAGRSASFSGVARGASVIAVQVFSRFTGANCASSGEDPCTLSFTSDQIAGLEYVYSLRGSLNIAAVNMSLGGGHFTDQAVCDAQHASRKMPIDNLRSAGIATVISSGNSAQAGAPFMPGVGAPACISSAVSVGNTTKTDTINPSSQSASFLSLLAPGTSINSSVPGGGFASFTGTSMAAPHVAGAWAIIKQRAPSASVPTVLNALRSTGLPIFDGRNGVTTPRIRILQALNTFVTSGISINDVSTTEGNGGTKSLTFTASLSQPSPSTITVNYVTADITATSGGSAFSNPAAITIPGSGSALLYPSTIAVSPGLGTLLRLRVTLFSFTHTYPADVDVVLAGPGGQTVLLMSDAGGDADISNVTLLFDDAGPLLAGTTLSSGTFRPTNIADDEGDDLFAAPAPAAPYGSTLAGFNGTDPAGQWRLWVRDDTVNDSGVIAGWQLSLTTTGGDYMAAAGVVTFPAGSSSQPIAITVNGDTLFEPTETFRVTLSNAAGATIADGEGTGTILSDDFTDFSLSGLPIRAVHILELRAAINAARAANGLAAFNFTDPALAASSTAVRAVHILELRTALAQAYTAAKRTPPSYTDSTIVPGATTVKAAHIAELREAAVLLP